MASVAVRPLGTVTIDEKSDHCSFGAFGLGDRGRWRSALGKVSSIYQGKAPRGFHFHKALVIRHRSGEWLAFAQEDLTGALDAFGEQGIEVREATTIHWLDGARADFI